MTLREQIDAHVPEDVELFEEDGKIFGRDEHGEFAIKPMAGSGMPPEPDDYAYDPCGHVLKYTYERYGQTRYCTGMAGTNFGQNFSTCKHHKSREKLMERAQEMYKHGHFAVNYINFAEKLDPAKFIFAMEMMGGLLEQSTYDFEVEVFVETIDTSDSDIIADDAVEVGLPLPTNNKYSMQASELLQASLAEVELNNMRSVVFEDKMEKEKVAQATDMEGHFTDTITERVEHHLHLPISRLSGDIRDHLKTGGVEADEEDETRVTFAQNDYKLDVSPVEDTEEAEPVDQEDVVADLMSE